MDLKTDSKQNTTILVMRSEKAWYRYPVVFIRDAPDTVFAGYPVNTEAGYRLSGKGRISDVQPDTWLDNYIFGKI
jgi:hypothetical protein